MSTTGENSRRVLVVGLDDPDVLCEPEGGRLDVVRASSLVHACFLLDGLACEAAVIGGQAVGPGWPEGLAAVAARLAAPVVLVLELDLPVILEGLRQGAIWLPASAVREHPILLWTVVQ